MATPSSILAWAIPWMEDPGGLQSMGLQKESDTTDRTQHMAHQERPVLEPPPEAVVKTLCSQCRGPGFGPCSGH